MPNTIFNNFLEELSKGNINLESNTIKCALMTDAYLPDKDHDTFDNTHEVTHPDYTPGGKALQNKVITEDDTGDRVLYDADDVTWPASTITARWAVLYDETYANTLIAAYDFKTNISTSNADFIVQWHSSGILKLGQGD